MKNIIDITQDRISLITADKQVLSKMGIGHYYEIGEHICINLRLNTNKGILEIKDKDYDTVNVIHLKEHIDTDKYGELLSEILILVTDDGNNKDIYELANLMLQIADYSAYVRCNDNNIKGVAVNLMWNLAKMQGEGQDTNVKLFDKLAETFLFVNY